MRFNRLLDEKKINQILDLILKDSCNKNSYKISRIDSLFINFYFQLSESLTIFFKVYNPTQYGIKNLERIQNKRN